MDGSQKTVLVVEDDLTYRKSLIDGLVFDYTVIEANDGEEAVERFLVHKPDLIILDLLLPKIDGFTVLERLRHYPDPQIANIPVVILSNLSDNKDVLAASALKIDAYFVKSTAKMEEVYERVHEIVYGTKGTPRPKDEPWDFREMV